MTSKPCSPIKFLPIEGRRNVAALQEGLKLFSPAKINLFLRVMGKRPDGYHELASLFQAIDLGDTLTFAFAKEDHFTCSDPTLINSSNLVLKALSLFRQKTNLNTPFHIHLEKRIPMQAGLGGGSSNGATTLWALNSLHNKPYTEQELQLWSAELGSDLPFFFSIGTAYCTGRGEHVRNLPPLSLPKLALFKPPVGLSTPAVFKALNLSLCSTKDPLQLLADFQAGIPRYLNDLEEAAFRLLPILSEYKKNLGQAAMTGTGTAFFLESKINPFSLIRRQSNDWYLI